MTRVFSAIFSILALSLVLSGCVSSGTVTANYIGPTVSSASARLETAMSDRKEAAAAVRKAKRDLKAINRSIARNERRLKRKRLSARSRDRYETALKADRRKLRPAERAVSSAERKLARAERNERRAESRVASAKRRKVAAERRVAAAQRRKAEEEKRREQQAAQAAFARPDSEPSFGSRLFGLRDPGLKNIADYKARVDNGFQIAAVPVKKIDTRLLRQEVRYRTSHKPGTIVVDTGARYLYLVQRGGKAMRYGIGVGRQGFSWSGTAHIGWKQEWPKWTPPDEMIERQPKLARWSADNGGMPGGPTNPLGARALYLMKDGKDTLYRLHGTPEWASIGTAASSGCIRLINQDVIDLYNRVPNGAKVVVL